LKNASKASWGCAARTLCFFGAFRLVFRSPDPHFSLPLCCGGTNGRISRAYPLTLLNIPPGMPAPVCAACTLDLQPLTLPRDDRGEKSGLRFFQQPAGHLHGSTDSQPGCARIRCCRWRFISYMWASAWATVSRIDSLARRVAQPIEALISSSTSDICTRRASWLT